MTILKYSSLLTISLTYLSSNYTMNQNTKENQRQILIATGEIETQFNKLTLGNNDNVNIQSIKQKLFNQNLEYILLNDFNNNMLETLKTNPSIDQNILEQINKIIICCNNSKAEDKQKIELMKTMLNKIFVENTANEDLQVYSYSLNLLNETFLKLTKTAFNHPLEQNMLLLYHDAYTNNYINTQEVIVEYFKKLQTIKFKILLTEIMPEKCDNSYLEKQINNMAQKVMSDFNLEYSKAQLIDTISKNPTLAHKAIKYMQD